MSTRIELAPPLQISQWLNTPEPITLESLRGRVVVLHAFQMLCPGCVSHGLPQTTRIQQSFASEDVAVIGLHTVFEHHEVMTAEALRVFIHEYRLSFPIGIDQPSGRGGIPKTMETYALRGTPSLLIIDRLGQLRLNHFGSIDDMAVGAIIGQLLAQDSATAALDAPQAAASRSDDKLGDAHCDDDTCAVGT